MVKLRGVGAGAVAAPPSRHSGHDRSRSGRRSIYCFPRVVGADEIGANPEGNPRAGEKVNEIVFGIGLCLAAFAVVGVAGLAADWIAVLLILVTRQIKGE